MSEQTDPTLALWERIRRKRHISIAAGPSGLVQVTIDGMHGILVQRPTFEEALRVAARKAGVE